MRARALHFVAPETLEIRSVPVEEPGDGEVLVRTEWSGVSAGTEMLAYRGLIDPTTPLDEKLGALAGTFAYPFRYGYSCVGRIERSASALPEGTRVFAFHPHQDLFVVGAQDAVPLETIDARTGTLLPLVETGLQISLDAGAGLGETVVVLGLGPVGILAGGLIARSGARVIGGEPKPWRRAAAEVFGIRAVAPDELEAAVKEASDGRGADIVVEASGDPQALAPALELLGHEGLAVVASWYGRKEVALPLGGPFHRRRLIIRSSQVSTIPSALAGRWDHERRRAAARGLLEELPLAALATHDFPFERATEAYEAVARDIHGLIHAALRYG